MKTITYFIIVIILFNYSCKKEPIFIHFHGRVTAECDNQTPIANCNISIIREFDKGQTFEGGVGSVVTDNDGYYSLETIVPQDGKLIGYEYTFNTFNYASGSGVDELFFYDKDFSSIKGNDVEVNLSAQNSKAFRFHIKNINPVNSDDEFNSLEIPNNAASSIYEVFNGIYLKGINVDTTIVKFLKNTSTLNFKYSYTKNGVLNIIPSQALLEPNCLDTLTVDIFY